MKYRGNFDVDACERQFEKNAQREARRIAEIEANREVEGKSTKRKGRERARNRRPWQEEQ